MIIEQLKSRAAENQHLSEVARTAEQLQRDNKSLAEKIRYAEGRFAKSKEKEIILNLLRASELEAENSKLKHSLKNIHHELEQNKGTLEDLKITMEKKDSSLKVWF